MAEHSGATNSLNRRVAVITGATSGIGEQTARNLAGLGWEVVVVGRDRSRVDGVCASLASRGAQTSGFTGDLADREALKGLIREIGARYATIDVLVNNAGAMLYERQETSAASERTFALNVEAPFLLQELLLPNLTRSGGGRVVHIASSAHRSARMHFDDVDLRNGYSAWRAYSQSKLALVLMTREAALVHRALPVTFNCCHPGFVRSRFGDEGGGVSGWIFRGIKRLGAISVERGAQTPTYLATAPDLVHVSGEYFVRGAVRTPSRRARSSGDATRLWSLLEERTGLTALGRPVGQPSVTPAAA